MKKELIFSILIGFTVGLVVTIGIYAARKTLNKNAKPLLSEEIKSPVAENETTVTPTASLHNLSLMAPIDQTITNQSKTAVSGVTSPLSTVLIMGEKGEKVIKADKKGNFETEMLLISGENEIQITAVSEEGKQTTKTVTIVYTTTEI